MTNRISTGTEAAGHDTNGTVTSWIQRTVTVNASNASRSWTVELKDQTVVLLADTRAFSVTGIAAGLAKGRALVADKGTFTQTGIAADLRHTAVLRADVRAFSVTGVAAGVLHNVRLVGSAGSFSLTGNDATLTYTPVAGTTLPADVGSFLVVGVNAGVRHNARLQASNGTLLISPVNSVVFRRTCVLVANTRAFNFNFIPAVIIYDSGDVVEKSLYYQSILTDPRKSIVSIGDPEHQLVYYVKNFYRIL
jgi:hypothetical protein